MSYDQTAKILNTLYGLHESLEVATKALLKSQEELTARQTDISRLTTDQARALEAQISELLANDEVRGLRAESELNILIHDLVLETRASKAIGEQIAHDLDLLKLDVEFIRDQKSV